MQAKKSFITTMTCILLSGTPVMSQSTVGNGTVFVPSAGQREAYGINEPATNNNGSVFPTRHYSRGNNNSGIGGSFLGTESVTSESSPAAVSVKNLKTSMIEFRLPKLDSPYAVNFTSPALGTFSPALPLLPRSTALDNSYTPQKDDTSSGQASLENLPSFNNKQPSLNQMMRFDSFSKF